MSCTLINPVYARIRQTRNVRVYSGKGEFDKAMKKNKRMRHAIRKYKVSTKLRSDSNKIILEELMNILDVMDDIVEVLEEDISDVFVEEFKLDCGEVPNDDFSKYIDNRGWP
jgi:hypothetical protein